MSDDTPRRDVAVLASGGIESAVLCVSLLRDFARVFPVYVRFGLNWEAVELHHLQAFLNAVARDGLMPLQVLDEPMADVYGAHWSTGGAGIPGAESPDDAVYLPGRNLLLVTKAAVWCRLRDVATLALGCLGTNPFADSTAEFFRDLELVVNRALAGDLRLIRPFGRLQKVDVLRQGHELPLHLTFSCINPVGGWHCGRCNKCAERQNAFRAACLPDRTPYAVAPTWASSFSLPTTP